MRTAETPTIDSQELFELLAELVRLPSHPGMPRQEEAVAQTLARWLEGRGLPCELDEAAPGRPNLLCALDGKSPGRHLVLCGHTDTVPLNASDPGAAFSAEVKDGRMLGRGTADMKGALAAMAAAMAAIRRSGGLPRGRLTLAAVVDEELESLGAERLVHQRFAADGCIVGEATSNALHLGHKGLEWLEVVFTGRAAHGGTPAAGVNAIVAAARFVGKTADRLEPVLRGRRHPLLGPPTLNVGTVRGGDQPSTVAASCVLALDRRTVPGESYDSVRAELRELLAEVEARMPGLQTEVRRMEGGMATLEHLPCVTDKDHPLARAAAAGIAAAGLEVRYGSFPAWTDAGLLAGHGGIPCVVLGPGDLAVAHSPYESVALAEVEAAARIYAASALGFC